MRTQGYQAHQAHPYAGRAAVLATRHGKERLLGRPLRVTPGLRLRVPPDLDTDALGTFTGEVARVGTPLEVARRKARLGMEAMGLPLGLASEGSFGPHPTIPFLPADHELLLFVDDERGVETVEQTGAWSRGYLASRASGAAARRILRGRKRLVARSAGCAVCARDRTARRPLRQVSVPCATLDDDSGRKTTGALCARIPQSRSAAKRTPKPMKTTPSTRSCHRCTAGRHKKPAMRPMRRRSPS